MHTCPYLSPVNYTYFNVILIKMMRINELGEFGNIFFFYFLFLAIINKNNICKARF